MTRIQRELRTVKAMISLYCRDNHGTQKLCSECEALFAYAAKRLEVCPFQSKKPTCAKCPIHCYKPDKRAQVTTVMRYAGPRMILHHPILACLHVADQFRKPKPRGHREPR